MNGTKYQLPLITSEELKRLRSRRKGESNALDWHPEDKAGQPWTLNPTQLMDAARITRLTNGRKK
jgi:hypothetical protein